MPVIARAARHRRRHGSVLRCTPLPSTPYPFIERKLPQDRYRLRRLIPADAAIFMRRRSGRPFAPSAQILTGCIPMVLVFVAAVLTKFVGRTGRCSTTLTLNLPEEQTPAWLGRYVALRFSWRLSRNRQCRGKGVRHCSEDIMKPKNNVF